VTDRLLLVATSPRVPAGVLSWPAWEALRSGPVYTADIAADQARAVAAAGIVVRPLDAADERSRAGAFRDHARDGGIAVWLAGPDGDADFARAVGDLVAREGSAELEVVYGSWDPPGARLLDVVAVMDRLRSPGGCPWDAEQTHASLAPYLVEETYETLQALEDEDADALREELGDVLLQVVFHARLAEEGAEPWSVDDVAGDLVEKLVRRHPHVFADVEVSGAAETSANWDRIKRTEKRRESAVDGVPLTLPALLLAAALQRRAGRAGVPESLWTELAAARGAGEVAEAALRGDALRFRDDLRSAERVARADGQDPSTLDSEGWLRYWPSRQDGSEP
jgi:XTP/dITP diphosphohydrolase